MGNGAVVPLTGRTVFVTANAQHDVDDMATVDPSASSTDSEWMNSGKSVKVTTASAIVADNSPVASSSSPQRRSMAHSRSTSGNIVSNAGPRRSRAHRPTLLGLEVDEIGVLNDVEGGNQAREAVMLTGLGIHADVNATPPRTPKTRASGSRMSSAARDEEQFRIGSDTEDQTTLNASAYDDIDDEEQYDKSGGVNYANGHSLSDQNHVNGDRPEEDERTLFGYDQEYDEYDDYNDDLEAGLRRGTAAVKLPFESTTSREKLWMWTSVAFVLALSMVSLAIAVDWIDWPGDGIGKQ